MERQSCQMISESALTDPLAGIEVGRYMSHFADMRATADSLLRAGALVCVSPGRHARCDKPATAIFWQDEAEFYPCCDEHWPHCDQWCGNTRFPRGGRTAMFLCFAERIGPEVDQVWTHVERYNREKAT